MIDEKFGMLTVVCKSLKKTNDRGSIWICKCECGKQKEVSLKLLKNEKKPRSCGCSRQINSKRAFEGNYQKTEGCWEWQGVISSHGYGKIGTKGLAHRRAYEYAYGPIPKKMQVCHKCDNRKCVNPGHLFLGTCGDNLKDMTNKGRRARGSKIDSSVLNEEKILEIRKKRISGVKYQDLSDHYGVSWNLIRMICKNKHWKHVALGKECSLYISTLDRNQKQHSN